MGRGATVALPWDQKIVREQGNKNEDSEELSQTECTLTCSIQSCGSWLRKAFQAAVT